MGLFLLDMYTYSTCVCSVTLSSYLKIFKNKTYIKLKSINFKIKHHFQLYMMYKLKVIK